PAFPPFRLHPPADASSRQGTLPIDGSNRDCFPTGLLPTRTRGFVFCQQTRRISPAVSSFLSYGRAVHLLLLPTPCRHDAVAGRLQVTLTWRGLSPLQPGALSGALAPRCIGAVLP